MDISFSSFQCKRAQAPEIEAVIGIRKIRERHLERKRKRIECAKPIKGGWSIPLVPAGDYSIWEGSITPSFEPSVHIDPVTQKRFKLPNAPSSVDIANMLKFYGIGDKIHKCPECGMEGDIRSLLPHLNNTDAGYGGRSVEVFEADEEKYFGKPVDKPRGEVFGVSAMTPSGRSFTVVQPHRSHGWNFKQIGEWMAKEGY